MNLLRREFTRRGPRRARSTAVVASWSSRYALEHPGYGLDNVPLSNRLGCLGSLLVSALLTLLVLFLLGIL